MIESSVVSLLKGNAPLVAAIGGQVYAVIVPATATYPCISYHSMSKPPSVCIDRAAQETARIQIDCWGSSYASVKTLQQQLHSLLDGFQGKCPDNTFIDDILRDVESDYWESDAKVFRAMSEYIITYPSGQ